MPDDKAKTNIHNDVEESELDELVSTYTAITIDGITHAYGIDIPTSHSLELIQHPNSFFRAFLTPAAKQITNSKLIALACELENLGNDYFIEIKESSGFQQGSAALFDKAEAAESLFAELNTKLTELIEKHRKNENEVMSLGMTLSQWNEMQDTHVMELKESLAAMLPDEQTLDLKQLDDETTTDDDSGSEGQGFPTADIAYLLGLRQYSTVDELTNKILLELDLAYEGLVKAREVSPTIEKQAQKIEQANEAFIHQHFKALVLGQLHQTKQACKDVITKLSDFNTNLQQLRRESQIYGYDPRDEMANELSEVYTMD